jgi:flagellar protein FlbT
VRETDPASRVTIDAVNDLVSGGALYKAPKEIRKPIKREEELLAA